MSKLSKYPNKETYPLDSYSALLLHTILGNLLHYSWTRKDVMEGFASEDLDRTWELLYELEDFIG